MICFSSTIPTRASGGRCSWNTRRGPKKIAGWQFKANAAGQVLGCPVILAVLYLERGKYVTFPGRQEIRRGGLRNAYEFEAVRLWEHAERIASGDLPELAPLLLALPEKTEAVLEQERRLILDLPVQLEQRRDLLAVATMVGTRYFDTRTLQRIFREEMAMLKEANFIQGWINEGRAEAEAQTARRALTEALTARFGSLRPDIRARLDELNAEQCFELLRRAVTANSLADLGFRSTSLQ